MINIFYFSFLPHHPDLDQIQFSSFQGRRITLVVLFRSGDVGWAEAAADLWPLCPWPHRKYSPEPEEEHWPQIRPHNSPSTLLFLREQLHCLTVSTRGSLDQTSPEPTGHPSIHQGNGMNLTSQPRVLRMDHSNNVIISRGDLVAAGLFPDCRTIEENTDFHFRHHNSGSHDNPRPDPNNNPEVHHCETTSGENLNIHSHRGLLKAPENLCGPGESSGKDKKIRKKSVSFDDDVMVFLFDQVLIDPCNIHLIFT